MSLLLNSIFVLCIAAVKTKKLHTKEGHTEKKDLEQFLDFFNFDDSIHPTGKSRPARHIELVTESVLEHLLKEINNKYPHSKNESQYNITKMMRMLKMKLKRQMNKKKNKKTEEGTVKAEMLTTSA